MPTVGFETTVSAGERPKTYALDRAATGNGKPLYYKNDNYVCTCIMVPKFYIFVKIFILFTAFLRVYMFVYVFCHFS